MTPSNDEHALDSAPFENLQRFLSQWVERYGKYHDHKEQMAYTAAILYAAAASWLVVTDSHCWSHYSRRGHVTVVLFLLAAAVMGAGFIVWQMRKRRAGAIRAEAGLNVIAALLTSPPEPSALRVSDSPPLRSVGQRVKMPAILRREIHRLEGSPDARLTYTEVYAIVSFFGLVAAGRVLWDFAVCRLR